MDAATQGTCLVAVDRQSRKSVQKEIEAAFRFLGRGGGLYLGLCRVKGPDFLPEGCA